MYILHCINRTKQWLKTKKKSSNVFSSFYAAINCVFYLQDNSSPGDKEGLGRYRQNCQENCPDLRVWRRRGGGEGAEKEGRVGGAGTEERRHLLRERRVVMLSVLRREEGAFIEAS